jgi:DNA-binding response OmpR family regulator
MDRRVRVIIVEDDRDLRESLVEYLTLAGHDVTGVGSGLECYRAMAENTFLMAVVDVGLPDQCGYVLAEYIRKNTAMGVIILTARDAVEDRVKGYGAGADLYLVKPIDCRELTAAISSMADRQRPEPPVPAPMPRQEAWRLVTGAWQLVSPKGEAISLTAREMQFMTVLAATSGRPIRRETLLTTLGYGDDEYANRAMDSLVRRLRRKIEESLHLPPPIKTIHAVGYCFSSPIVIA